MKTAAAQQQVSPSPGHLFLTDIIPNPDQTRKHFDQEELESFAVSLRRDGVIQPIIVKPYIPRPGAQLDVGLARYEIIAGERRWRASGIAGLIEIPVSIREDISAEDAEVLMLVENLQRVDLTLPETCAGVAKLVAQCGGDLEEVSKRLGKAKSWISKRSRLEEFPDDVRKAVADGIIGDIEVAASLATLKTVAEQANQPWRYDSYVHRLQEASPSRDEVQEDLHQARAAIERMAQTVRTHEANTANAGLVSQSSPGVLTVAALPGLSMETLPARDPAEDAEHARLTKLRDERAAAAHAILEKVEPIAIEFIERLGRACGIEPERYDDGSISFENNDLYSNGLEVSPDIPGSYEDSEIPSQVDDVRWNIGLKLTTQQVRAICVFLERKPTAQPKTIAPPKAALSVLDGLKLFLKGHVRKAKGERIEVALLHEIYEGWCEKHGHEAESLKSNNWAAIAEKAGLVKHRTNAGRVYLDIEWTGESN